MNLALLAAASGARRRRWNPTRLAPSQWLRADLGVSATGALVDTYADQSGNGNDCTHVAADATRPVLTAGGVNGHPYLACIGGQALLNPLDITGAMTVIHVLQQASTAPCTLYSIKHAASGFFSDMSLNLFIALGGAYLDVQWRNDADTVGAQVGFASALGTSVLRVLVAKYAGGGNQDTSKYTASLDGVAKTPVAAGVVGRTNTDKGSLFARVSSANAFANAGNINHYETIIVPRVITADEETSLAAYMTTRYGVA